MQTINKRKNKKWMRIKVKIQRKCLEKINWVKKIEINIKSITITRKLNQKHSSHKFSPPRKMNDLLHNILNIQNIIKSN